MGTHPSKAAFSLILLALLTGCAAIPPPLDQKFFYKRDMELEVNGLKGVGVLVVPRAEKYKISAAGKAKMDLFVFESCHREETVEKAGDRVKLDYSPNTGIEDRGACPVKLGSYEKDKGRHYWGFIDFETEEANLPAVVKCNGSVIQSKGVSICQSRAGLLQEITFQVDVVVNPDPACPMARTADPKTFRFKTPLRECVYNFMEKAAPHREHRLTTVGYEQILLREG